MTSTGRLEKLKKKCLEINPWMISFAKQISILIKELPH